MPNIPETHDNTAAVQQPLQLQQPQQPPPLDNHPSAPPSNPPSSAAAPSDTAAKHTNENNANFHTNANANVNTTTTTSASASKETEVLPDYALQYAPIVWLHSEDKFFPGLPNEHIQHVIPRKFMTAEEIPVPAEYKGKLSMLTLDQVNKQDVFLTMEKDVRTNPHIDELCSPHCKPDKNGKSLAPVWMIIRDKTGVCPGEGKIEDVFYFYHSLACSKLTVFKPYNEGNTVLFKHFGNHVGDWEHCMIRFINGKPEYMHLSAHSDGNAWKWELFEKQGERPVIYSAGGSHAMYPKAGTHNYSGVFLVGPKDHASRGYLWDPTLNFVVARSSGTPEEPADKYTYVTSPAPGFNKDFKPDDIVAVLTFKGRWGNSFSDLRFRQPKAAKEKDKAKAKTTSASTHDQGHDHDHDHDHGGISSIVKKVKHTVLHDDKEEEEEDTDDELHKAEAAAIKGEAPQVLEQLQRKGVGALSIKEKLLILIWAEGPTGPRDKSLERTTVNRWKAELCTAL